MAQQVRPAELRFFAVGHERRVGVATIEMLGIPLAGDIEVGGLPAGGLFDGHLSHCELFGFDGLAAIGAVDVLQQRVERGAIGHDVMAVDKHVQLSATTQQLDADESSAQQVEGLGQKQLFRFDVINIAHHNFERLVVYIERLQRLAVVALRNTAKQCRVSLDSRFHSTSHALCIDAAVERTYIRQVIEYLAFMANALCIDAILRFG